MAKVNRIEKKAVMPKWNLIKFQILTYCYLNNITVSQAELDCLTLLSLNEPVVLTDFCFDVSYEESWIFKSSQSVRNALNKCEKKKLVIKDSKDKKLIKLNPDLKIITAGNILLDIKFLAKDDSEKI
jgi:hypothetical protein